MLTPRHMIVWQQAVHRAKDHRDHARHKHMPYAAKHMPQPRSRTIVGNQPVRNRIAKDKHAG